MEMPWQGLVQVSRQPGCAMATRTGEQAIWVCHQVPGVTPFHYPPLVLACSGDVCESPVPPHPSGVLLMYILLLGRAHPSPVTIVFPQM